MKGSAGNISTPALAQAAFDLDAAFRTDTPNERLPALVSKLMKELTEVLAGIEATLKHDA